MKKPLVLTGSVILLGILGLSAYVGARLMAGGGQGVGSLLGFGGPRFVYADPAPELPETEPQVVGIYVRREGNSLFLGTGNLKFHRIRESDAEPARFESGYDGPVVEVLATHDTEVYFVSEGTEVNPETENVRQSARLGSLDEMGQDHLVQAWGERRGDRLVAEVLAIWSPPG